MYSRRQLARQLTGFYLDGPSTPGKLLTLHGQPSGKLTSCVASPRLGWIGLGVVKTQLLENNSTFVLADSGLYAHQAQLPFAITE